MTKRPSIPPPSSQYQLSNSDVDTARTLIAQQEYKSIFVTLIGAPGHSGVQGNEKADRMARKVTFISETTKNREILPVTSLSDVNPFYTKVYYHQRWLIRQSFEPM